MKKFRFFSLSIALCLCLIACSNNTSAASLDARTKPASTPLARTVHFTDTKPNASTENDDLSCESITDIADNDGETGVNTEPGSGQGSNTGDNSIETGADDNQSIPDDSVVTDDDKTPTDGEDIRDTGSDSDSGGANQGSNNPDDSAEKGNAPSSDKENTGPTSNETDNADADKDFGEQESTDSNPDSDTETGSSGSQVQHPVHTHSWTAVYQTIHHDEIGHYETQVIAEAWDEAVYAYRNICSACGEIFVSSGDAATHTILVHDGLASYFNKKVQVDTIHHEAVTEQVWVVDQAAYDEKILVGYECTGCDETKSP